MRNRLKDLARKEELRKQELKRRLEERLIRILKENDCLYNSSKEVTETTLFEKDLGLDSLDRYEYLYYVEETLGVNIPDDKANDFENIKDYANYLEGKVSERCL